MESALDGAALLPILFFGGEGKACIEFLSYVHVIAPNLFRVFFKGSVYNGIWIGTILLRV